MGVGLLWLGAGSDRAARPGSAEPEARSPLAQLRPFFGLGAQAPLAAAPQSTALGEARKAFGSSALSSQPPSPLDDEKEGAPAAGMASDALAVARSLAPPAAADGTAAGASSSDDDTPRDARVSGRVVDATGGPIPGAKVRVHFDELARARHHKTGTITFPPAPDAEWLADAQGEFAGLAPAGSISFVASAEAYTEARRSARAPVRDVVLALAPAARVTGRVQREDASPVSGATLRIKPRGLDQLPIEGTSDERGEFSIGAIPAGVVEVTASAPGLSSEREWLRLTVAELAAPLVFTLTGAHSVYGVVRLADGSPCTPGILSVGRQLGYMTELDAHGNYRVDGLDDGTHELMVNCLNKASDTRTVRLAPDSPPSIELNWQLDAGFVLAGSIRRRNGEPFAGAMVRSYAVAAPEGSGLASRPGPFVGGMGSTCDTNAAGEFQCSGLRAGWYRVNAGFLSGASATSDPVRVDAETKARVELIVPDFGEVRVRIADGGRVGGLFTQSVFARGAEPIPIPAALRGDLFVFEGLALGRYRVGIGRAASEPGPSAVDIELTQPGQVIEVELHAPEPMTIGGTVVDANGAPMPDAWVDARLSEPGFPLLARASEPALTDTEGRFEIADLLPGRYAVTARHSGGEAHALEVGTGQRVVRLVIEAYGSLSGRVTGPDGKPARQFSVLAHRETPGDVLSVDGDRGVWSLSWVPPGEYRVVFSSSSGLASANAQVASGSDTKLAVKLDPTLTYQDLRKAPNRR